MQNTRGKMFCAGAHLRHLSDHLSGNKWILEITCGRKTDLRWGTGERKTAGEPSVSCSHILRFLGVFASKFSDLLSYSRRKIKEETHCRLRVTLACYVSVNMFQVHADTQTNLA